MRYYWSKRSMSNSFLFFFFNQSGFFSKIIYANGPIFSARKDDAITSNPDSEYLLSSCCRISPMTFYDEWPTVLSQEEQHLQCLALACHLQSAVLSFLVACHLASLLCKYTSCPATSFLPLLLPYLFPYSCRYGVLIILNFRNTLMF